jgi:hypothetical protein
MAQAIDAGGRSSNRWLRMGKLVHCLTWFVASSWLSAQQAATAAVLVGKLGGEQGTAAHVQLVALGGRAVPASASAADRRS